jgi:hypothetical protein
MRQLENQAAATAEKATEDQTTIHQLTNKVAAVTTERDSLAGTVDELKAEVTHAYCTQRSPLECHDKCDDCNIFVFV